MNNYGQWYNDSNNISVYTGRLSWQVEWYISQCTFSSATSIYFQLRKLTNFVIELKIVHELFDYDIQQHKVFIIVYLMNHLR